jgi:hypothetical protein
MIVEDGSGRINANSYTDVNYADAYWDAENNTLWANKSDDEKEVALIQASKELDRQYSRKWIGQKETRDQTLCWPRVNAVDPDGYIWDLLVPQAVKNAVCELALQVVSGTDLRNKDEQLSTIKAETTTVGEISIYTAYANPVSVDTPLNIIDNIVSNLVIFGGRMTVKASRV